MNNKYFYKKIKDSYFFGQVENSHGEIVIKLKLNKEPNSFHHYFMDNIDDVEGLKDYLIQNFIIEDFSELYLKN